MRPGGRLRENWRAHDPGNAGLRTEQSYWWLASATLAAHETRCATWHDAVLQVRGAPIPTIMANICSASCMKAVALTPPIMRVADHGIACARACEYAQGSCMRVDCADETVRRQAEDDAIQATAKKYPDVVQYTPKPNASLKVTQYSFRTRGN